MAHSSERGAIPIGKSGKLKGSWGATALVWLTVFALGCGATGMGSTKGPSVPLSTTSLSQIAAGSTEADTTPTTRAVSSSTTAAKPFPAAQVSAIHDLLAHYLDKYGIPGGVVGVWGPGREPLVVAEGTADTSTGEPLEATAPFRAGSITKTFVATVVLQLVEEGRLSLQDTLAAYLPGFPDAAALTIRELLNHTSGLFSYTKDEAFRQALAAHPLRVWTPAELVAIAARHPPLFAPGADWAYSDTDYILLGMIVEQVTGRGIAAEIKTRIADPLGLSHTYLAAGSELPGNAAHGYSDTDTAGTLEDVTALDASCAWASGALVTDASDLATFWRALLAGALLRPDTQKQMLTWVAPGDDTSPPQAYGLGIAKLGNLIGHAGSIGGFESAAYYLPGAQAVLVAWVNRYPTDDVADSLVRGAALTLFPDSAGD